MRDPQFKSAMSPDRFLADAAAGCPRDQVENFLRAGLIRQIHPHRVRDWMKAFRRVVPYCAPTIQPAGRPKT